MRKLSWAEDFVSEASVVVHDMQAMKGNWKQHVNSTDLHVEIGSGKGDYWMSMANAYPSVGWVGIEKDINVAALAVRKYQEASEQPSNMAFIHGDAEDIEEWFAPHEVDVIHLNFSDPWPKKRAHKKRLSHQSFVDRYARLLSEEGELQLKTDNASLFEFSLLQFQEGGFFLHEIYVDYRRETHDEDAITEYEARFLALGQPIYRAVFKKIPYINQDKKKR